MRFLSAYGTLLTVFPPLNYLGRTFSSSKNDWSEVEHNLRRAQVKRVQLANILGREGAYRRRLESL